MARPLRDALGGEVLRPVAGRLHVRVPAQFGRVLIGHRR
jgi:hypothetical protein